MMLSTWALIVFALEIFWTGTSTLWLTGIGSAWPSPSRISGQMIWTCTYYFMIFVLITVCSVVAFNFAICITSTCTIVFTWLKAFSFVPVTFHVRVTIPIMIALSFFPGLKGRYPPIPFVTLAKMFMVSYQAFTKCSTRALVLSTTWIFTSRQSRIAKLVWQTVNVVWTFTTAVRRASHIRQKTFAYVVVFQAFNTSQPI